MRLVIPTIDPEILLVMAYKFNRRNALVAIRFMCIGMAAYGFISIAYWLVGKYPPHDSAAAAAWVQAFGSIVAIGVAIYIPYQQRAAEQRFQQYEYWSRRYEIEYRIHRVAFDLATFVERLIEESRPSTDRTILVGNYSVTYDILENDIDALEVADLGISGHERLEVMRNVVRQLRERVPLNSIMSIPPDSTFSKDISEGPVARDVRRCLVDTKGKLAHAQRQVARFNLSSLPEES